MSEIYNNIIEFDELSSTNDYALELVRTESVPDFTVISTQFQTKGRGQIGNLWVSNKGENLLFSIILHPNHISANNQFILSQCVSLALRDFIAEYCNDVTIKWPNDIYVGTNKIAGILIENLLQGKNIETAIIGIGLNVNQTFFEHVPNPTSLKNECGQTLLCDELLPAFIYRFSEYYSQINNGKQNIHNAYLQNLYLLQKPSTFKDKRGIFTGTICGVELDGRLQIETEQHTIRRYFFKEVEYLH